MDVTSLNNPVANTEVMSEAAADPDISASLSVLITLPVYVRVMKTEPTGNLW